MACLACGKSGLREQLNVGAHPVSSYFLTRQDAPERKFSLGLGQCEHCGMVQLTKPVPHDALIPPYDWLFAREPEEHLDTVVDTILALPGINTDCVIGALTSKDDTTIERFQKKGFSKTWRLDLEQDFGITNKAANIESVQKLTAPALMEKAASRNGPADIFIVRHILEHAEDLRSFIEGVAALVKPGGLVMVEVPDCSESLADQDYAMVWEEHSIYFSPQVFWSVMSIGGFEIVRSDIYPRPFENSLVQLARKTGAPGPLRITPEALETHGAFDIYAKAFAGKTTALRAHLENKRREGPLALLGAGHLACAFVNYHGLADLFEFVADDTPQKQGKFLPGARLPILPSGELVARGVKTCLLALSIENEDKVIERNAEFVKAGGVFRSIFAASGRSMHADLG